MDTCRKEVRSFDRWESLSSTCSAGVSTSGSSCSSEASSPDDASLGGDSDVCSEAGSCSSDVYVALIISIEPSPKSRSSRRPRSAHSNSASAHTHKSPSAGEPEVNSTSADHSGSWPPPPDTRALLFFASKQPAKPARKSVRLELPAIRDGTLIRYDSDTFATTYELRGARRTRAQVQSL